MRSPKPWGEVFMEIAQAVALRSKDPSTQVGAVLIDHKHVIVSVGFNGPPSCLNDKSFDWSDRARKYALVVHAEQNALIYGLKARRSLEGCTLYVTGFPCHRCVLMAATCDVHQIVYGSQVPVMCDDDDERARTELVARLTNTNLRLR